MIRCSVCVMPNTRPDTEFVGGVCSACLAFQKRPTIDWDERKRQLLELLDRFHGEVIVPSSGGKDSTYQAITLAEMGADVTCVTASTCYLTAIGRANLDNLKRFCRTVEYSPNATTRAKLNRLGLEMVGDISWPEHVAIFTTPFRAALDLRKKLVMYGENPQNQYGGPLGSEEAKELTQRWRSEFGGFLGLRPSDLLGMISSRDLVDYSLPGDVTGIEAHFLGQYIPWDSHRNAAVAKAHGMRQLKPCEANFWEHENLDNAQTGIHDHGMYRKYGYGRGCAQVSVDVRAGLVDRAKALEFVKDWDGEFPVVYAGVHVREICDRLDLSTAKLAQHLNQFTNWEMFDANQELHRPERAI